MNKPTPPTILEVQPGDNPAITAILNAAEAIVYEFELYQYEVCRVIPETYSPPTRPDLVEENAVTVRVRLLNNLKHALAMEQG